MKVLDGLVNLSAAMSIIPTIEFDSANLDCQGCRDLWKVVARKSSYYFPDLWIQFSEYRAGTNVKCVLCGIVHKAVLNLFEERERVENVSIIALYEPDGDLPGECTEILVLALSSKNVHLIY